MRNTLILILVCFGIFGAAIIFYHNKLLGDYEMRLKESIMKQIEDRIKTEEGIKQELDIKRREREFLQRLESERELKDMLEMRFKEYDSQLQEYNQKQLEYEGLLAEYKSQMEKQSDKLSDYEAKLIEYQKGLDEQKQQQLQLIKDMGDSLTRKLQEYSQQLFEYERQLAEYKKQLSQQNSRLDEYDKQLLQYKTQIEEQIKALAAPSNIEQ